MREQHVLPWQACWIGPGPRAGLRREASRRPRARRLVRRFVRETVEENPHQFPGGEQQSALVRVIGALGTLPLVVGLEFLGVHPRRVRAFHQVVA